jgi:hypothetical protein
MSKAKNDQDHCDTRVDKGKYVQGGYKFWRDQADKLSICKEWSITHNSIQILQMILE